MRTAGRIALLCAAAGLLLVAAKRWLAPRQTDAQLAALAVAHSQNATRVPPYEVLEITFLHANEYPNPFSDVTIDVVFTSPSGRQVQVGGFHYGSLEKPEIRVTPAQGRGGNRVEYVLDKQDTWKARFASSELGRWTYSYTFTNADGQSATGNGEFACVESRVRNPGFLRQDPNNPFRWVFDDGSPFYPIGLQDCWGDGEGNGSALAACSMEGPFRTDRTNLVELPPGPLYVRGPSNNPQNGDVYFRLFSQCGFNLYRFSQQNCSYVLYRDLDHYLPQQAIMTDELLRRARSYGLRMMYGLFGYQKVFSEEPDNTEGLEKVKRFIKYSVDRWGAYVDVWEFLNEQKADERWYEVMVPYLRSLDPYHHPITTSWEKPELPGIEVNAPHWYQGVDGGLNSDQTTASRAANWKKHGKPVIVGEHGNHVPNDKPRPPGVGGVWDAGSALRMRIRNWTAFFSEIAFIFWNTSYARDGHFMNIWLGPQEREYVRAMQDFSFRLGPGLRMVEVSVSDPQAVRAYGLASDRTAGAYLHHYASHETPVTGLTLTLDVPQGAQAYWYSPEDASILGTADLDPGRQTLPVPEFTVDIALLITADGPPDIDGDGQPNDADTDDDNDGVPDSEDAFPLDPSEWADADADLIGDNMDADDDGDGVGDDRNGNGMPDCEELDLDGDGVDRAKAVPWDAFPLDPNEWRDTDGDGIGDNADDDDDGDGFTDAREGNAGTDPLDRLSFPGR
jgi:hypothetical protein